jgi:hypothetical protein
MARYAGGGKNTVEGCRSIDVLEWHRLGYLRCYLSALINSDEHTAGGTSTNANPD